MSRQPLPIGTWGSISTCVERTDDKGKPDVDHDGPDVGVGGEFLEVFSVEAPALLVGGAHRRPSCTTHSPTAPDEHADQQYGEITRQQCDSAPAGGGFCCSDIRSTVRRTPA